jgi:tRNA (cmo5U34)-methyltransferase
MLEVCRARAAAEGFESRCAFHEGYVESLPDDEKHHGATCLLVSQFILSPEARTGLFRDIAARLVPGGILASTDLASDRESRDYEQLLVPWFRMMSQSGMQPEAVERMRKAYAHDVAVLPAARVAAIIQAGGFEAPVQFYQAGLIHGWISRRR